MTGQEDLREPAPADLTAGDINLPAIHRAFTELIVRDRPELFGAMMAGELSWHLEPFDAEGWTSISVRRTATGEDLEAGAAAHWTAIILPRDQPPED